MANSLRELAFRTLVELASRNSGEELLGNSVSLAANLYRKSLIGRAFPNFWLEVPLLGDAGFDLHVYYDRAQVRAGDRFARGSGFGMQALFDWFFGCEVGGVGVGFAHDLRAAAGGARVDVPADVNVATGAYVNFNRRPLLHMPGFFEALGAGSKAEDATRLMARLPDAWRPWYLGVFPKRAGAGTRVGAFVGRERQQSYVSRVDAFGKDLAQANFTASDGEMLRRLRQLAALPFRIELQLDAMSHGTGPTLGVDLTLGTRTAGVRRDDFVDGGNAVRACRLLEEWGAADARWHHVANAFVSHAARLPWEGDGDPATLLMRCTPAFLKAKWVEGELQPAKVYLKCATCIKG